MESKLKCPFCQTELEQMHDKKMFGCPKCLHIADGAFWAKVIESQRHLKLLEPIVASLQGRADINAEVARDSNELVTQWYEKYEQSQKELEIATNALEKIKENYEERFKAERDGFTVNWDIVAAFYARTIVANTLEQIEHFADVSKMIEHKE